MKSEMIKAFKSAALWTQTEKGKATLYTIGFPFYAVGFLTTIYPLTEVAEHVATIVTDRNEHEVHEKLVNNVWDKFLPIALLGAIEVIAGMKWLRRNRN